MSKSHETRGVRGRRFAEVHLVLEDPPHVELFSTFPHGECLDDQWRTLDPVVLALQCDVSLVVLDGPRYWTVDSLTTSPHHEPSVRDIGGVMMQRSGTIELDGPHVPQFFQVRLIDRNASWAYNEGSVVHELLDPDGATYVMDSYSTGVDASLTGPQLDALGERLSLPHGWRYRTRSLRHELVVDATDTAAVVVRDDLHNSYCLVAT